MALHRRHGVLAPIVEARFPIWPGFGTNPIHYPNAGEYTRPWSLYDVYSTLTIEESFTVSGDPALNQWGSSVTTFDHRTGAQSEARTGVFGGPRFGTSIPRLPVRQGFPSPAFPANEAQVTSTTERGFYWSHSYDSTTLGRITRTLTREVGGLLDTARIRADLEELLLHVDLAGMEFNEVTTLLYGPVSWRVASFGPDGEVVLRDNVPLTYDILTRYSNQPPARSASGLYFRLFSPATGWTVSALGAQAAMWAGWTPNPTDEDPTTAPGGYGWLTSTAGASPLNRDRFTLVAGKAYIHRPPVRMYGRATDSRYGERMVGEECARLVTGSAQEVLVGAQGVDEDAHPGALSLHPWDTWADGGFLQVSAEACG